jgi:hypothetical protein
MTVSAASVFLSLFFEFRPTPVAVASVEKVARTTAPLKKAKPMVATGAVVVSKDWKTVFLSLVNERLHPIEKDYQMESMDDISKSFFAYRSDINEFNL